MRNSVLVKKIITEEYKDGQVVSRTVEEVYDRKELPSIVITGSEIEVPVEKTTVPLVEKTTFPPTIKFAKAPGGKYKTQKEYLINGNRTLLL